jgi:hypothetical protein
MWPKRHGKERNLDSRAIAAILRFCFAGTDEVNGHAAEELSEELLIKLRSFAAGKMKRNELEKFSETIVSNNLAIETLALEIKQHWGKQRSRS